MLAEGPSGSPALSGRMLFLLLMATSGCSTSVPESALEEKSVAELISLLDQEDWRGREAVGRELSRRGPSQALLPVLETLEQTDNSVAANQLARVVHSWDLFCVEPDRLLRFLEQLATWNRQLEEEIPRIRGLAPDWQERVGTHLRTFGPVLLALDTVSDHQAASVRNRLLFEVHKAIILVDQGEPETAIFTVASLVRTLRAQIDAFGDWDADGIPTSYELEQGLDPRIPDRAERDPVPPGS